MNKIICDICGTSYPESAEVCPICGCAKDVTAQSLAEELLEDEITETEVKRPKGGRFAASNVRKRKPRFEEEYEEETEEEEENEEYEEEEEDEDEEEKSNAPLIVLLVIVIAALLVVTGFIFVRYFLPNMTAGETTPPTTTAATTLPDDTTEANIPCTSLVLTSGVDIQLEQAGFSQLIHVSALPENTTDAIIFTSSDESVAVVGEDGTVTAVGEGEAVITILCGAEQIQCNVVCDFVEETTAPPENTIPETTVPETTVPETTVPEETLIDVVLEINRFDMTFAFKGDCFQLGIPAELTYEDITWTSENPNIAKVENGLVTAVGYGTTKIYAEYGDQKVECIVRCVW